MKRFKLVCLACEKLTVRHRTVLYVDWDKRFYAVLCEECGKNESFDEFGDLIKGERRKVGEVN